MDTLATSGMIQIRPNTAQAPWGGSAAGGPLGFVQGWGRIRQAPKNYYAAGGVKKRKRYLECQEPPSGHLLTSHGPIGRRARLSTPGIGVVMELHVPLQARWLNLQELPSSIIASRLGHHNDPPLLSALCSVLTRTLGLPVSPNSSVLISPFASVRLLWSARGENCGDQDLH